MAASGAVKVSPGWSSQEKWKGWMPMVMRVSWNWVYSTEAWKLPEYTRAMPQQRPASSVVSLSHSTRKGFCWWLEEPRTLPAVWMPWVRAARTGSRSRA